MATLHPQSETRHLSVRLSVEEVAGKADELASKVKEAREQEDAIEEAAESWKRKKKAMTTLLNRVRSEAEELAAVVETGREEGEVQCDWLYALNAGMAFLVRRDTLELVSKRELREDERQTVLGEVLQEPTPAQLTEWLQALRAESMDAEPIEPNEADLDALDEGWSADRPSGNICQDCGGPVPPSGRHDCYYAEPAVSAGDQI